MHELFFFDRHVLDCLPEGERSKYEALLNASLVPDGRPFFLDSNGLPDRKLDGFCNYLVDPMRSSPKTWATYAGQVNVFLRFMEAQGKSWIDASRDDLKLYQRVRMTGEHQCGPVMKGRSWNVAKSAIVQLYDYAVDAGFIEKPPFRYRRSKAIFRAKEEMTADLSAKFAPEPINFISIRQYKTLWRPWLIQQDNGQRNTALVDLLITVGLRISEALSLEVHQMPDPDAAQYVGRKAVSMRVVGKGKKPRKVLVPKRVLRAIQFYIEEDRELAAAAFQRKYGKKKAPATAAFLSERGTKLSARSVQSFFANALEATGIRLTPHGCRHTFAVYQLEAMIRRMTLNLRELREGEADAYRQVLNDPLRQLQLLLGHSHITTTYIYLDFLEESEALVDESLADWTDWENGRER